MSPTSKIFLWRCLDGFICIFILSPLVVIYWRGSFQLLDIYIYPSDLFVSAWISVVVGICGTVLVNVSQNLLHTKVDKIPTKCLQIFCKRLYTYFYGWIIVVHWRGIWRLWDAYTGTSYASGCISFAAGCAILLLLKCFRNVVAPPLVTVSDFDENYFIIKTLFRTKPSSGVLYLLDSIFSVAVPGSLVVTVWRGLWTALDGLLETAVAIRTFYISAAFGFGIIVIQFFLQWPAAYVSKSLEAKCFHSLKIIFEDCFFLVACFGVVNLWRAVWGFCDLLVLPEDYTLSNCLCHITGALATMLLLHGNTVLVRDVQIDGEYTQGRGCWFFSKSLTLFEKKSGLFLSGPIRPEIISAAPSMVVSKEGQLPEPREPSSPRENFFEQERLVEQSPQAHGI
ncbi:hypothetical protein RvY_11165 [Ramazzottius varieornatus]|uniref:Uncharacterized protein n=1 Tax=Ramazzottius varieornatus TaxID=947166 RepID=A0A1D1VF81_RAMVA|nr:hypothetical protein RvY_11165 [Ramazzottius varieornatus]